MLPGCIYVALHFFLTSLMKVNLYAFLKRINICTKTSFQPNVAYCGLSKIKRSMKKFAKEAQLHRLEQKPVLAAVYSRTPKA